MNKTAALIEKLASYALENPESRKGVVLRIAQLQKMGNPVQATQERQAGPDTAAFAAWAVARGKKYSEKECQNVLDRLKVPFIAPEDMKASKRGPLQVGETVSPDAYNNTNEANADVCQKYHKKFGEVEHVDNDGVAVRFDDGKLVRFEGPNKPGKSLGIGRASRPVQVSGRPMLEVIYSNAKNKPPTQARILQIQDYVDRGEARGDVRSRLYHSGHGKIQTINKQGQFYFRIQDQTRDRFPTSINPKKGIVWYIGRLGGRPGGWKKEYERMTAEAGEE